MEYIKDLYGFPGFQASARLKPHPTDKDARIVTLKRRQKKQSVRSAVPRSKAFETAVSTSSAIMTLMTPRYSWSLSIDASIARCVKA